jgi:hypothetical protein
MAQSALTRPAGYSILNPTGAPAGGHAGYGKGANDYGTEAQEEAHDAPEPIMKQVGGVDDTEPSQTSTMPKA